MIMRIDVVLPAPFGPMKPYRAPRGIVRSSRSTAFSAPNVFVTPRRSIAALSAACCLRPLSARSPDSTTCRYSRANATSSAGVSRPTANTTYCLPSSKYVIGLPLAAPGSGSSATTAPVALS